MTENYEIKYTKTFLKKVKKLKRSGYDLSSLIEIIGFLNEKGTLPRKYKEHTLKGEYVGIKEAHIKYDWLLIWDINEETKIIELLNTGTHSEIFK